MDDSRQSGERGDPASITPARYERIGKIFREARERPHAERDRCLRDACGDDTDLRSAVAEMLLLDESLGPIDRPVVARDAGIPEAMEGDPTEGESGAELPPQIPRYRITEILGQGGMGTVYRAEQRNPRREVALKVIRPGLSSPELLRRLEREAQILASLQHPGIAQVYDAGSFDTPWGGQPFFAMELVEGRTLGRYAVEEELSVAARLELVGQICSAIQHAHEHGVIHRDLKPSNILVTETGQTKILDFGIARLTDSDIRAATIQTGRDQLLGTVPYMSPEQVSGRNSELDARSDVYSIGVIAYELLAGRLPHDLEEKTVPEAARIIQFEDPDPLARLDRSLRGDISTVISKSLEKDRELRYRSVEELEADIRRLLQNEPVLAKKPTTIYQLRKFTARNRAFVGGVLGVVLALTIGLVGTARMAIEAHRQRDNADLEARVTEEVNRFLNEDLLAAADPRVTQKHDLTVREALDQAAEKIEGRFDDRPRVKAAIHRTIGVTYLGLGLADRAEPHLTEALRLGEAELGPRHLQTLKSRVDVGSLHLTRGEYVPARACFESSLRILREEHGIDHELTQIATTNLALVLRRDGELDEAERLLLEVLESETRTLGETDFATLTTMNNLALVYMKQDRQQEAEDLYRRAISIMRGAVGDGNPLTVKTSLNLVALLKVQERLDEARGLAEESVSTAKASLGGEHPETLTALRTLADIERKLKNYDAAEPVYREVLQAQRRIFGDVHRDTLQTLSNLALVHFSRGEFDRAEILRLEALEGYRQLGGELHLNTLVAQGNLAGIYVEQGRVEEAAELLGTVVAGMKSTLEKTHWVIGAMQSRLGECLIRLEQYDAAEVALLESHEILHGSLPPGHSRRVKVDQLLVRLYENWGRPEDAAPYRAPTEARETEETTAGND